MKSAIVDHFIRLNRLIRELSVLATAQSQKMKNVMNLIHMIHDEGHKL